MIEATVLYGKKGKGWTAVTHNGERVTLPPEGGRIIEGENWREPKPAEKKPRPACKATVLVPVLKKDGDCFLAPEWAIASL